MAHKRNDIPITISFSENSKGWTSFKSFLHENGVSLNNRYYTFKSGHLWEHNENEIRGSFYGGTVQPNGLWSNADSAFSHVEILLNDAPGSVKSFGTLNYEGSQAKNTPDITNDAEYYNNFLKMGWYVEEVETNLQSGISLEFKDKEGKWFSQIKGETTKWLDDGKAGNIDTKEFSVQGIGNASEITCPECPPPGPVTSWNCVQSTTTSVVSSCVGLTEVNAGNMFSDMHAYLQYISDPVNNLTSILYQLMYACVDKNGISTTWGTNVHIPTVPANACECNNGTGWLMASRGASMPQGDVTAFPTVSLSSNPLSWDSYIIEINSWGISPPIPTGTTYNDLQPLLDIFTAVTSTVVIRAGEKYSSYGTIPFLEINESDFCECTLQDDPGDSCICVEVLNASGTYPTESSCLTQCCGTPPPPPVGGVGPPPSTPIIPCDWITGGMTTGHSNTFGLGGHTNRPGASISATGGTVIDDPTVFFSTHPGGNSWTFGANASIGFPGWILDDSYMVRRAGSNPGDIIRMPSGRCWEFHNTTFPPQQTYNAGQSYPTLSTNAGSYNAPYQVPYWHTYIGKNPEVLGNEDWWRECSCNT